MKRKQLNSVKSEEFAKLLRRKQYPSKNRSKSFLLLPQKRGHFASEMSPNHKIKIRIGHLVGQVHLYFEAKYMSQKKRFLCSVKFLNLKFNVGGCYDISRDCFVCDVDGLYFFAVSLASSNESRNFEFSMNVTFLQLKSQNAQEPAHKQPKILV